MANMARQRHVLQTMYVDRLVGEMLDALQQSGRLDDTAIVVTGDHGVAFEPGQPQRMLTSANAAQIAWVPLFVHAPGQGSGRVDDRRVSHVDVLPTLAPLLDVDIPFTVDGVNLSGESPGKRTRVLWRERRRGSIDRVTLEESAFADLLAIDPTPGDPALGALQPYARGHDDDLLGGEVADYIGSASEVDLVALDAHLDDLDGRVTELPVYVTGRIGAAAGQRVALALDGVIVGVGTTWPAAAGTSDFAFVAPPSLVGDGGAVSLYAVENEGARRTLRAIE
jgi:hypothetical protein